MDSLRYAQAAVVLVAIALLVGCGSQPAPAAQPTMGHSGSTGSSGGVDFPHVHGIGFSADGKRLLVAAHTGLRIYSDGAWHAPAQPIHDYMGYAPVDNGFYSSGHPDPASGMVNPLGLVKSVDEGKTITTLGFSGESDFHIMGVGYTSHAIYVFIPMPSGGLPGGMSYSLDEGKNWQQSALRGLEGQPIQIAVHPSDTGMVAAGTEGGLFLSSDFGASFVLLGQKGMTTAVAFNPQGSRLYFGTTTLSTYDLGTKTITALPSPQMGADDAIGFIAVSPTQPREIVIATFGRDIYRSTDGGQSWQTIAQDGQGM